MRVFLVILDSCGAGELPDAALFGDVGAHTLKRISTSKYFNCEYDDRGNIGKRYRRQDEIGTPWCVTYDFDSQEDHCVTVRERDTMAQERVKIDELPAYFAAKLEW